MYKINIVFLIYLSSFLSFSQEIVTSIPLVLKKDRDVFQIVNDKTKETTLFVSDKKTVNAIRLNGQIQIIDSLSTVRPEKMYSDMIGYTTNTSNTTLFWSSENHKEILTQSYNFEGRKVTSKNYNLPLKDERFLQKFSENEKFYILTVLKNSNTLKLYVFGNDGKLEEKVIDLTGFRFFQTNYSKVTIYGLLSENLLPLENAFELQKINPESPTSLTESAKKRKCYSNAKQIILTFDNNFDLTQMVTLDLENFTAKQKLFKKPFIQYTEFYQVNSNSFLIDDRLYQIKVSTEKFILNIKDPEDHLLKEYVVTEANPISFKNSDIIQENGEKSNTRILEKTSQFIRKVNNLNCGISCYKKNDDYIATIGSISEVSENSAVMYGAMFGAGGVLIAYAISNPTYQSFNSYSKRKVVYINCLFDKNGNHLDGELQPLAFDKMRDFFEANKAVSSPTLFKLDNSYFLGFYNNYEKMYKLRKFED
ncbi:hypothetical protein [Flavobacterium sp. GT3R68]|uniref:hypothetical protein n=1 Tax=Flavobacterium sp. GT3R68 TaxID=2594437 RepID=UPI000F883546|nr:hypothetical protein [Flavobacterium sp. GT3R68]RTY96013.1 hypothetical protein EKL32_05045 [Flavobacterium sp. GSN2]TRW93786.1 hypothetical protein FNW07_02435 [Flavobacterium sp. GT3R68]